MARLARHTIGAAFQRPERRARPRHHLALHERDDLRAAFPRSVRRDGIAGRVRKRRGVSGQAQDGRSGRDRHRHGDDADEGSAEIAGRRTGRPGESPPERVGIGGGVRIAGQQFEQRRELGRPADTGEYERRFLRASAGDDERRHAERALDRRRRSRDLADVSQRELERAPTIDDHETQVGEDVLFAARAEHGRKRPRAPQDALPRQRNVPPHRRATTA